MASTPEIVPLAGFREKFAERGGERANRCYQCATCSSVCELAPSDAPFPRRQMLWAQWGLADRLASDAGVWLCHQCNDCNLRCPRDVRPGDVMAAARAAVVERLAFPAAFGRLVGNARSTWPLLVAVPIVFWIVVLALIGAGAPEVNHALPALEGRFHYEEAVPHWLIYTVFFSTTAWVLIASWTSGRRFWQLLGAGGVERRGSFLLNLIPALGDVATHSKFSRCEIAPKRRWGHLALMWGFVGAAVTSGFAILYLYRDTLVFSWLNLSYAYPVPLTHWVKWLGNLSALALVVGSVLLIVNRLGRDDARVGATTAFDRFFLGLVVAVVASGVLTEVLRFVTVAPIVAVAVYVVHLGVVLSLFLTLPYSKFAHLLYRTLAMVHERMTATR